MKENWQEILLHYFFYLPLYPNNTKNQLLPMKLRKITFAWLIAIGLSVYAQNPITTVTQVSEAVTLTDAVDYTITGTAPFATAGSVDIQNPDAAVVFENIRPSEVISKYLKKITANGVSLVNNDNARVSIYRHGAIVFAHSDTKYADGTAFYPVVMCSDDNCTDVIEGYNNTSRNTIGAWKDAACSFILKRGYMCTVANESDGTGYSHCYIANSADRKIKLNKYLAGKLGFFRIFRWQWPTKLGMSDARDSRLLNLTNSSWFYDWGAGTTSQTDYEYVPQRHHEAGESNNKGYKGAWESWENINASDNTCTHVLGQNEPDNTSGEGEVFTYVTEIPSDARAKHGDYPLVNVAKDFLYSGKRIGTFACCNPNTGMVTEYIKWCKENNIRVDFVATHYYIGGTDPAGCISRLKALYNATGLPVWATEWNNGANWSGEGGFSTDEGEYTWGSGNDQQKNGEWLRDVLKRADNEPWLERLAVYNAVETKREIWTNGAPTKAAEVLSTYKSGFAYSDGNEYFMPWTYKNPENLAVSKYNTTTQKVTLTWTHKNSKQSNSIRVQRKEGSGRYKTISDIGMRGNGELTFTDDVEGLSGGVTYQISDIDNDGTTRYSNEVTVDVAPARGNEKYQYGTATISSYEEKNIEFTTKLDVEKSTNICMFTGSMTENTAAICAGNLVANNYGKNYFSYQMVPWKNKNVTIEKNEELSFLALPMGNYKYGDLDCEVGYVQSKTAKTDNWTDVTEVTFQQAFPEGVTPIILTEIRKTKITDAAICTRVFDVTNTGFKFIIYSENAANKKVSTAQTVCYFAITPGIGMMDEENQLIIAAGMGTDEEIYGITARTNSLYAPIYDENSGTTNMEPLNLYQPTILTALQTNNYPALCMLRRTNVTKKGNNVAWTTGFKTTRILDRDLNVGDNVISKNTYDEAYRDKVGWVALALYKEGGSAPTAIKDVSASQQEGAFQPRVVDGRVYVDGVTSFNIYNISGAPLASDAVLTPGIYVIRANGKSVKILVK